MELSELENLIHKDTYNRKEIIDFAKNYPLENHIIYPCQTGHFYVEKDYPENVYDPKRSIVLGHGWDHKSIALMGKYVIPGSTVLDIGAHIGSLTNPLCDLVGPTGQVIAFEPILSTFSELCWNMALNRRTNVKLYWAAIGAENTFISSRKLGLDSPETSEFNVQILSLDSLHLNNISFIKVDIESMEDQFILGAQETLKRCRPALLIELMGGHSYDTATPEIKEAIDYRIQLLEQLDYKVYPLGGHDYLALPKIAISNT